MITLYINTTDSVETYVAIEKNGQTFEKKSSSTEKRSQMVLPLIQELLDESSITLQELTAINLATGPGSFTGIRVGAVIAGNLSLMLNIPINNLPPGTIPPLSYGKNALGLPE